MIDAVGNPQSILLLGGTSEIGLATVEAFASDRPLRVVLAGRPSPRLDEAKARLEGSGLRGRDDRRSTPGVETHADVIAKAFAGGDIDVALVAFGLLGDNEKAWTDVATAVELAQVNYTAAVARRGGAGRADDARRGTGRSWRSRRWRASGRGAPTSSTAPRRPGSTRSTRGSPRRCARSGVHVTVVRPGFVHTRMTEGLKPAPLSTTPGGGRGGGGRRRAHPQGAGVGARAAAVRDERAAARPAPDLPPPAYLTRHDHHRPLVAAPGGRGHPVGSGANVNSYCGVSRGAGGSCGS